MDWPLTVSELRSQAALAEATIGELAAHLNASLRADLAALLRDCADFVSAEDGHGDSRAEPPETVWDRFRSGSDLYELTVGEAAAAIAAGPARWDAVDEWRAGGRRRRRSLCGVPLCVGAAGCPRGAHRG